MRKLLVDLPAFERSSRLRRRTHRWKCVTEILGAVAVVGSLAGCAASSDYTRAPILAETTTVTTPSFQNPTTDDGASALPATLVGQTLAVVDARYGVSKVIQFGKPLRLRFGTNGMADVTYPCAGNSGPFAVSQGKIAFEVPGVAAVGCGAMVDPEMEFLIIASVLDPRVLVTNQKNGLLVTVDELRISLDLSVNNSAEDTPPPASTIALTKNAGSTVKPVN